MSNSRLPMPREIIEIMSKNEAKVEWVFDPVDPSVLIRFNILDSTFQGATLKIPDGTTNILYNAGKNNIDRNKIKIKNIIIPDSVTNIGDSSFYSYPRVEKISFGSNLLEIGTNAFYGCSTLTSLTIPDSVTDIGDSAFYGCNHLSDIYYSGTEEEWNAIAGISGCGFKGPEIIHYNSTDPES